jgi:hypothetical protein
MLQLEVEDSLRKTHHVSNSVLVPTMTGHREEGLGGRFVSKLVPESVQRSSVKLAQGIALKDHDDDVGPPSMSSKACLRATKTTFKIILGSTTVLIGVALMILNGVLMYVGHKYKFAAVYSLHLLTFFDIVNLV